MADESLWSLLHSCPRCHRSPLFDGVIRLRPSCDRCGLVFEQEGGQNWGAMVLAYCFGAVLSLPLFFVLLLKKYDPLIVIGAPTLVLAVLSPLNIRFSRTVWAHVMFHLHGGGR